MSVVLDAEALLAFAAGAPGAGEVKALLEEVQKGREEAFVSVVNLAEARYVLRKRVRSGVDDFFDWLTSLGVVVVPAEATWRDASTIQADHGVSLGQAFALATARERQADLVATTEDVAARRLGVRLRRVP